MNPICIYPANSTDGFTAAWIVHKALGEADLVAAGKDLPVVTFRDVVIVGFTYKRSILEEMIARCRTLLVLDHHDEAVRADLGALPPVSWSWAAHQRRDADTKFGAVLDPQRSAAQIAWDFFFPGRSRPLLVDYVADRDLRRFKLRLSRRVNAFVSSHKRALANWDELDRQLRDEVDVQRVAEMVEEID
jgi:hypothetical protein